MRAVKSVVITASSNYSLPAQLLAELLFRKGIRVQGFLIIRLLSVKRFKTLVKDRNMLLPILKKLHKSIFSVKEKGQNEISFFNNFLNRIKYKPKHNITSWAKSKNIKTCFVEDLNSDDSIAFIKKMETDAILYCGGGIVKKKFIAQSKLIINAHAGPLPEIRGMNAAEWSLLLRERPEITIHEIDAGIDTGPIIQSFPLERNKCKTISQLRDSAVIKGIEGMVDVISRSEEYLEYEKVGLRNTEYNRQCFAMAPILLDEVKKILANEKGN